ncbi:hypothetical protein Pelo_15860 [Pelomyxa schiedti]|nr:hypothetical protein Pelo_15860 [Pelomyxa schiedti]
MGCMPKDHPDNETLPAMQQLFESMKTVDPMPTVTNLPGLNQIDPYESFCNIAFAVLSLLPPQIMQPLEYQSLKKIIPLSGAKDKEDGVKECRQKFLSLDACPSHASMGQPSLVIPDGTPYEIAYQQKVDWQRSNQYNLWDLICLELRDEVIPADSYLLEYYMNKPTLSLLVDIKQFVLDFPDMRISVTNFTINLPHTLDLKKIASSSLANKPGSLEYSLFGVVGHWGGPSSGCFEVYILFPQHGWVAFPDGRPPQKIAQPETPGHPVRFVAAWYRLSSPWSPAAHMAFPPKFRICVPTVLHVARCLHISYNLPMFFWYGVLSACPPYWFGC